MTTTGRRHRGPPTRGTPPATSGGIPSGRGDLAPGQTSATRDSACGQGVSPGGHDGISAASTPHQEAVKIRCASPKAGPSAADYSGLPGAGPPDSAGGHALGSAAIVQSLAAFWLVPNSQL